MPLEMKTSTNLLNLRTSIKGLYLRTVSNHDRHNKETGLAHCRPMKTHACRSAFSLKDGIMGGFSYSYETPDEARRRMTHHQFDPSCCSHNHQVCLRSAGSGRIYISLQIFYSQFIDRDVGGAINTG